MGDMGLTACRQALVGQTGPGAQHREAKQGKKKWSIVQKAAQHSRAATCVMDHLALKTEGCTAGQPPGRVMDRLVLCSRPEVEWNEGPT